MNDSEPLLMPRHNYFPGRVLPEPDRAKVRIGIRWHTGATDELCAARAIHPGTVATYVHARDHQ